MELILSFAAIIIFSLYDYFGFHISYKRGWENFKPVNRYRVSQLLTQIIITIVLFFLGGWFSALAFNLLWWTWWADILFYFWYDTLRAFGYPRNPGGFREQVLGNKVTWAYWTPWGLIRSKNKNEVMRRGEIFFQAAAGMLFVTALYLFAG